MGYRSIRNRPTACKPCVYSHFPCNDPDPYWCLNTSESQKSGKDQNQMGLKASFPWEVDAVISRPLSLKSRHIHSVFAHLLWEYSRAAVVGQPFGGHGHSCCVLAALQEWSADYLWALLPSMSPPKWVLWPLSEVPATWLTSRHS